MKLVNQSGTDNLLLVTGSQFHIHIKCDKTLSNSCKTIKNELGTGNQLLVTGSKFRIQDQINFNWEPLTRPPTIALEVPFLEMEVAIYEPLYCLIVCCTFLCSKKIFSTYVDV